MSVTDSEIQKKLMEFYKTKSPLAEDIVISDVVEITDGWETEVYSFKLGKTVESRKDDLILRMYPGDYAREKSTKEFGVMKKLHDAGSPVPQVFEIGFEDSPFGKPFVIMQKINGRSMGQAISKSSDLDRMKLISQFCGIFVDIHALDWKPFVNGSLPYEADDPYAFIKHEMSSARRYIDRFQKHEIGDPILDWLEARVPDVPCERFSVLHCDYHPYNILLQDDGRAFVIDWVNFNIGDFRFDLAWTLLLMGTYGNPEAREIILREYERIAGSKVQQIEYFEVFASARRLIGILMSLESGAEKMGMRAGAEEMMRRSIGHIKKVYALMVKYTGITVPQIEREISNISKT